MQRRVEVDGSAFASWHARNVTLQRYNVKTLRGELRGELGQSRVEFALMIGMSVSTLRNWEQGRRTSDGPALALLRVLASLAAIPRYLAPLKRARYHDSSAGPASSNYLTRVVLRPGSPTPSPRGAGGAPPAMEPRFDAGDEIYVVERGEGLLITPFDPASADGMAAYARGAKTYRNALRRLAR